MQLCLLHKSITAARQRQIVEWLLGPLSEQVIVEIAWPQAWSDQLFCPPRNFDDRKRARRFLAWLVSHGVPAERWLDNLGVEPPPSFAHGNVGRAYMLGDYVVKLTANQTEAQHASVLTGVDLPNLAKIYDVAEVDSNVTKGVARTLYAIIQQRLPHGASKRYRVAGGAVYDYLDQNDRPIDDPEAAAQEIISGTKADGTNYLPPAYRNDRAVVKAVQDILSATKDIYDRTGVMLQDPHGGNIKFKGGNIGFFDIGRSSRFGGGTPTPIKEIA